ncbi:MAG: cation transporter [Clostridia bacterium]|nr:cation transporter [Clostridia bacterium]
MTKLLINAFIKDKENIKDRKVRTEYASLVSVVGIILNLLLFGFKMIAGLLINSIAVISDSFNNLSDMGSSLVSAIGMKLSMKKPDKEHPFGHGRIEYISALMVAFIILLVGFELFKGSLEKIISPQEVKLSLVPMIILCVSVLVKLWMFFANRYVGKLINSDVIKATAQDSLNDSVATFVVIIGAVIGAKTGFAVDGILGAVVSVMIFYAGISLVKDTVGVLLGKAADEETVKEISEIILSQENITGIHDLMIHDYGPGRIMASVHAEVPSDRDIQEIHELIDWTEKHIEEKTGVHIVIHMDPVSVSCARTNAIRQEVIDIVKGINEEFGIHDFRMTDGQNNINLIFDLEVPCSLETDERNRIKEEIVDKLRKKDARYTAVIVVDSKHYNI